MGQASKIFIGLIILIVFISAFFLIYYYWYSPSNEEETVDIFLRTFDNRTSKQIPTGYSVVLENGLQVYQKGQTLKEGRVKIPVPLNTSFYLVTYNIDNQDYYSDLWRGEPQRLLDDRDVEIYLNYYSNPLIGQRGRLGLDSEIILDLTSKRYLEVSPCVRWSSRIVRVDLIHEGMIEMEKPERLKNMVDKCYSSIDASDTNVTLKYTTLSELNEADFIRIYFLDSDYDISNLPNKRLEDEYNNDIAGEDLIYEVL